MVVYALFAQVQFPASAGLDAEHRRDRTIDVPSHFAHHIAAFWYLEKGKKFRASEIWGSFRCWAPWHAMCRVCGAERERSFQAQFFSDCTEKEPNAEPRI
jgi:hypothetical protein